MDTTSFRKIPKNGVGGRLPVELDEKIRREAYENKTSYSAELTKWVARGMGRCPEDFGLISTSVNP